MTRTHLGEGWRTDHKAVFSGRACGTRLDQNPSILDQRNTGPFAQIQRAQAVHPPLQSHAWRRLATPSSCEDIAHLASTVTGGNNSYI